MKEYEFVKQSFSNISDERESKDEFSDAEQISNLLGRVLRFARFLNTEEMPPVLTGYVLGSIYERLEQIEDHFNIEPEYIDDEDD